MRDIITVDPRIKFGLRMGDCFVKNCHCIAFFFGDHEPFLTNRTNFVKLIYVTKETAKA